MRAGLAMINKVWVCMAESGRRHWTAVLEVQPEGYPDRVSFKSIGMRSSYSFVAELSQPIKWVEGGDERLFDTLETDEFNFIYETLIELFRDRGEDEFADDLSVLIKKPDINVLIREPDKCDHECDPDFRIARVDMAKFVKSLRKATSAISKLNQALGKFK